VSTQPFSLRIFVADGDPDGLRIVERSNWVGRALVFPRAAWAQPSVATRPELQQTGVYLLLGPREDGEGDRLYIGEGDPIKPRLAAHHSGKDQKDFWTRAICFVSMGQVGMARGRPRRHAGVFAAHAGHAAGAGRACLRAATPSPRRQRVLAQQGSAYVLTQDYAFSSPSLASSVVLGRSSNGRTDWKDAQGISLKVLQSAATS